jgi:hypothetical protein
MRIEVLQGRPGAAKHAHFSIRTFTLIEFQLAIAIIGVLAALSPTWAANAPQVKILQPPTGASSVLETATLEVEAQDDQPLPEDSISLLLNGVRAQGSFISISQMDERRILRFSLHGALASNRDYDFEVIVTDSEDATHSARIYFDTFDPESVVIEVEDYNFESGLFIDHPIVSPEGDSNAFTFGGQGSIDESDHRRDDHEP